MNQKKEHSVSSEVKERLQNLFKEENEMDDDYLFQDVASTVDPELREIKAIILSIEWEITDEIMTNLSKQIEALKTTYRKDRILVLFLQLLGTVGKYIQSKKADAHPDSIKLLNSAYRSFETAVTNKRLSPSERKELLQTEVNRFKTLREQIHHKTDGRQPVVELTEKHVPQKGHTDAPYPDDLRVAIEEIKTIIHKEFEILRAELKTWLDTR